VGSGVRTPMGSVGSTRNTGKRLENVKHFGGGPYPGNPSTRYRTTYCTSMESWATAQRVSPRMKTDGSVGKPL